MTPGQIRYARRNAAARAEGYASYWHKRQTERQARYLPPAQARRFVQASKRHPSKAWRDLYMKGARAFRKRDFDTSDSIVAQLGEPEGPLPPSHIFWYHDD